MENLNLNPNVNYYTRYKHSDSICLQTIIENLEIMDKLKKKMLPNLFVNKLLRNKSKLPTIYEEEEEEKENK